MFSFGCGHKSTQREISADMGMKYDLLFLRFIYMLHNFNSLFVARTTAHSLFAFNDVSSFP